jgi:hypothetical protein
MILNSDVTASQKLGVAGSSPSFVDRLLELKDKALGITFTKQQYIWIVSGCVVLIVFRKIHYKAKTYKFNLGGYKK